MADYKVYYTTLRNGTYTLLGELSPSTINYSTVISQGCEARFTLPLRTAATRSYGQGSYVIENPIAADSPDIWYRFNEMSGTTFASSGSATGGTGTIAGGTDVLFGQPSPLIGVTDPSCIALNTTAGSTATAFTASPSSTDYTNTWTFEAWVKPTTTSGYNTLVGRNGGSNWRISLDPSNKILVDNNSFSRTLVARTTDSLNVDEWYHVCVTRDGTAAESTRIFINGVEATYDSRASYTFSSAGTGYRFGAWFFVSGNADKFVGYLDEVAVYGSVLSDERIAAHANNTVVETTYTTPELSASDFAGGKTAIFIERDNVCVWSGILWKVDDSPKDNTLTAYCGGWHTYFKRRYLKTTKTYVATTHDQAAIFKDLIDWAQSQPVGDIGVDTSAITNTGTKRDRTYYAHERQNIGTLLEQLAAVEGGFDWYYTTDGTSTTGYTVRPVIVFPTTGRITPVRLELGSNVEMLNCTTDATQLANVVEAKGAGEGPNTLFRSKSDSTSLSEFPLLEAELSHTDVTQVATLSQKAGKELNLSKTPVTIPNVSVDPDADPSFGSYSVGDQVTVAGSYGYRNLNEQKYRINTINVAVDASGKETITLDLALATMFE